VNDHTFMNAPGGRLSRTIDHRELMHLSFQHLHASAGQAWCEGDNNSWHGGISLTDLGDGLVSVVHHLPNVFLACFNEWDVMWWRGPHPFDARDHDWPSTLPTQERYRFLGPEAFYAVELTPPSSNVAGIQPGTAWQDGHCRKDPHYLVNRCVASVLHQG
jgi:hypothetical protein